jgi:hypothetical protein
MCHSARAQTPAFAPSVEYSAGANSSPTGVAISDVNSDGKPDILTANSNTSSISVLLGTGTGSFGTNTAFSTGASYSYPYEVTVGDMNGDGKPDIITSNSGNSSVSVLLGTGTGSFSAATSYSLGTYVYPNDLAVNDVNGDGRLDIITANNSDNSISVLLGTGTGSFGAATSYKLGTTRYPVDLAIGDVNSDGKPDILTANNDGDSSVSVLLGTGTGSFGAATSYDTGFASYPRGIALGDVNGDDKPDILTANNNTNAIGVLLGTGTGSFGTAASYSAGPDSYPNNIAVGDINGDGKLDVITSNGNGSSTGVLLGTGTGTFGSATIYSLGEEKYPTDIAVGDMNGDGKLDILTANANSNTVSVLLNTTDPTSIPPTVTAGTRCGAGTVTLQANGAVTGGSYRWYTVATGGTAINGATGNSYTTPTLYGTTTYYVSVVDASGIKETARTPVTATISYTLPPTIVASGSTTINAGSSVTLTARPNLALQFDGSSQYVTTTLDAQPSALPTTTWEAWVYPTLTNSGIRQTLFSIDDGAYDRGVDIEANTNDYAVFTGVGTWIPTTVDLNTWQHIAVVYTPTGISFYKNGVEYVYDTSNGFEVNPTNNKFQIARNPGFNEPFKGQLDEVRVWNYQRTQAQIQTGMFAVPAGTTTGLVGLWRFNEGSGKMATDATGNYPGTLISSPTYVAPGQTSLSSLAYTWAPTTGLSSSNTQAVTATPNASTTYTVTVADNGSCPQEASQLITVVGGNVVINTPGQTIATGTYNSITINSGGVATLAGNVSVSGTITINNGGTLNDGCALISGTGSFTLAAGGTLGVCDLAGIAASGNTGAVRVTGPRSFSPDASYVYNGGDSQVTGSGLPSQVRSFTTTNNSTVRLSNPLAVSQVLTVGGAGNFDLNGQALTLLSRKEGSALVVNAGTGLVSGGTATVQRYLDPTFNTGMGYRHYSAPVSGSTVADLATPTGFMPIINEAYNASTAPGTVTPFPTVFGYNQSRLATTTNNYPAFDKGFYSPSALTEDLVVGQGYAVQIGADQLVDFTGQLNTGSKTMTLGRNAGATAAEAGWALVGNPYPAPLDWSQVAPADRANLDGSIYVVQSTGPYTGSYRAYVNNLSSSGTNSPLIGTGQGFFVRVSAGQTSGTLTFRNSQRVTDYASQAPVYRTTADQRPLVRLELRTSAGQVDGLAVYAETGATPSYDAQYDAGKLVNSTGLNLASLSAAQDPLAIDGRPAFTAATVVPLTVGVPVAGTYTLAAAALANLPAGLDAYLTDAQTGQTVRLAQQSTYSFSVTAPEATALLTGRFTLSFKEATPLATAPALATIAEVALYPNPASTQFKVLMPAVAGASQVQATLLNALGQVVRRQAAALPATGASFTVETVGLPAGVYTLRLQAGATTVAKRVIIK